MFDNLMKSLGSAAVWELVGKALLTAAFIAVLSEIAKRSTWLAAALVALPLATMLTVAFTATSSVEKANQFANSTFFLFWPGLVFFLALPAGQQVLKLPFWWAFALAVVLTFASTWGFTLFLRSLGVKL
jgi:hypothetical protein